MPPSRELEQLVERARSLPPEDRARLRQELHGWRPETDDDRRSLDYVLRELDEADAAADVADRELLTEPALYLVEHHPGIARRLRAEYAAERFILEVAAIRGAKNPRRRRACRLALELLDAALGDRG